MTPEQPAEALYRSPFATRWASRAMLENWSDLRKFRTWRRLWIALAEAQQELGLDVSEEQLHELRAHRDDVNFDVAAEKERELRHDVMAHVHAYGEQCPRARGIIHLGATSAFVGDNADLILMREGLKLICTPLAAACRKLAEFARTHRDLPCLAYTHFQPAQVTTVGKRACLWLQDLLGALREIAELAEELPFRGVKGTTGTQASFLALFDGDHDKVKELERLVAVKMGFQRVLPVTGQTYPRALDYKVLATLGLLAAAAAKMANDLRLLAGLKELEEPFGPKQVGSSAMAYKRNPMRCERMASLARFLLNLVPNAAFTAAEQWLERTLDDSAVRRLALPEAFLAADSVARIAANVTGGLVVNDQVIAARLRSELPFMATENVLMAAVRAGGDRQELHERIRRHAMAAAEQVKQGGRNDLLDRIRADDAFAAVSGELDDLLEPSRFVGRAPEQVDEFLREVAGPALAAFPAPETPQGDLRV
ncbi:MAG: adenylosuccinate lyase [Planctomycetes bacterium SM23_32]|nr:MAG: adenylosuccinate lyase [Planctomycetes bacterium SM23_32]